MQTVYIYSVGCKYIQTLIDLWFSSVGDDIDEVDNGIVWIDYDCEPSAEELEDAGFDCFQLAVRFDVQWGPGGIPFFRDNVFYFEPGLTDDWTAAVDVDDNN